MLDDYARALGLRLRSAALQRAIHMLRYAHLNEDCAAAWEEWDSSGERSAWEGTAGDGAAGGPGGAAR